MCGISLELFFSFEKIPEPKAFQSEELDSDYLLKSRGPDKFDTKIVKVQPNSELFGLFTGCVLWLQGNQPTKQPLVDEYGNIFLWNGDDLNINPQRKRNACDSESIFASIRNCDRREILKTVSNIEGPWSFVYFDACSRLIHLGRDVLGRRSLLWTVPDTQGWKVTSVAERSEKIKEVPAIGIFTLDLSKLANGKQDCISLTPYKNIFERDSTLNSQSFYSISDGDELDHRIINPLNKSIPSDELDSELKKYPLDLESLRTKFETELDILISLFEMSLRKRVLAAPPKCQNCDIATICLHSKFAVLFSGGLDSTIIAEFLHETLSGCEEIDLLNVSFESRKDSGTFDSPDRESGIQSWKQLMQLHPDRKWNFVKIDVTSQELQEERSKCIQHLIAPLDSVLDDSIGCALYFAARGRGTLGQSDYKSSARVVFSGLGADEQCAGYSRYRGRFQSEGWKGLVKEIQLEMARIHTRNLGRDDRVVSHHGRTVRFPFLDEDVVNYLNGLAIWKKANLYLPRGIGEKVLLRCLAASRGLILASSLPKRAIQFGSRIAKLENSTEKGHQTCSRLKK